MIKYSHSHSLQPDLSQHQSHSWFFHGAPTAFWGPVRQLIGPASLTGKWWLLSIDFEDVKSRPANVPYPIGLTNLHQITYWGEKGQLHTLWNQTAFENVPPAIKISEHTDIVTAPAAKFNIAAGATFFSLKINSEGMIDTSCTLILTVGTRGAKV